MSGLSGEKWAVIMPDLSETHRINADLYIA
jgi:hypothetical protein